MEGDEEEREQQQQLDDEADESAQLVQQNNAISTAPAPGAGGLLRHVPGQTNLHSANSDKIGNNNNIHGVTNESSIEN